MAQHGLDRMDIGAAPNQMGRKGMAQGMRRYIGLDTGLFPVVLDNLPEAWRLMALPLQLVNSHWDSLPLSSCERPFSRYTLKACLAGFPKGTMRSFCPSLR